MSSRGTPLEQRARGNCHRCPPLNPPRFKVKNDTKVYNYVSFSCKWCFVSCHLEEEAAQDLVQSGVEDHTFGSTNAREHFPEDELTLDKTACKKWIVLCGENELSWSE